ncbi:MAG: hypothetical protein FWE88_09195 [Phycisphaerae bacterium]|nr:hypothetical protein [Phycisphaerae bacterium]
MKDPIIEELHRIRAERAAKFNYDIHVMAEDLRREEALDKARGVKYVDLSKQKKPRSKAKKAS